MEAFLPQPLCCARGTWEGSWQTLCFPFPPRFPSGSAAGSGAAGPGPQRGAEPAGERSLPAAPGDSGARRRPRAPTKRCWGSGGDPGCWGGRHMPAVVCVGRNLALVSMAP